MRKNFLGEFDKLWFDCLNGDSRETGKLTPDGKPDPSVFSTEGNPAGIRLGTTIVLMVRKGDSVGEPHVRFRDFWGVSKKTDLLASLETNEIDDQYERVTVDPSSRYSFRPSHVTYCYQTWTKLVDLCGTEPISGLQEMRHSSLLDIDRDALNKRMQSYFDTSVEWSTLKIVAPQIARKAGGYEPERCRSRALHLEDYEPKKIQRYALYPFDTRWCYYTQVPTLWNRARPELAAQDWQGNSFLVARMFAERPNEGVPFLITSLLPDYHILRPNAVAIALRIRDSSSQSSNDRQGTLIEASSGIESLSTANLSHAARVYLTALGIRDPDADPEAAELIWLHALAIGYSPLYLTENADGIRQDWPRIPLPDSKTTLLGSAALGKQIAGLLDTETEAEAAREPGLQKVAAFTLPSGTLLDEPKHFALTAGWGHAGKGGITMPGKGKVHERDYTKEEREAIAEAAKAHELELEQTLELLGDHTCDIYLNDVARWSNVPILVWEYMIGGYQVIKKWLSYREDKLLGRPLKVEEVRYVQEMARRIAAIILLQPALDSNYHGVREHTFILNG